MPKIVERFMRAGDGRTLKKLENIAKHVNMLEPEFEKLTDEELKEETVKFKARLAAGETLDDLLVEAFAAVREASKRTIGKRHFDVQLMGGAALHQGNVAEMRTGEGKTLVATLPSYLNALTGKGVHVVTTNDYLAEYQAELMGRVHRALGLETGVILSSMDPAERKAQYAKDITYGTNNEFGFDYLRDNMATSLDDCVQREHYFALVDEVDSILIDEARTPLIISGPGDQADHWYGEMAKVVLKLKRAPKREGSTPPLVGDYEVNEKDKTISLLPAGIKKIEDRLGIDNLYEDKHLNLVAHANNALKAKELFKRDKDYVVENGEIFIVDEHTGRILAGRRYNEGVHQAIEAKEGVTVMNENQTYATITLQNYFRMYEKLAGMTGTAQTEASELSQIYKLGVVVIPTNMPTIREDKSDLVFRTEAAKLKAVVNDIAEKHELGQPVLVGTTSVSKSEHLSKLLKRKGVPHTVLNAKHHEKEAAIVARAGEKGAVTVATNMAGRGTDIMLGGNSEFIAVANLKAQGLDPVKTPEEYEAAWPEALEAAETSVREAHEEVVELGGLYVLGTERHESRRIDNQLRGRAGRQGDPGETRFYLSLEDDLLRLFNSGLADRVLATTLVDEEQAIEARILSRAIETAQATVESKNFEIRKTILKYDDVLNRQRECIYGERRMLLEGFDTKDEVRHFINDVVDGYVEKFSVRDMLDEGKLDDLWNDLRSLYPVQVSVEELEEEFGGRGSLTVDVLQEELRSDAHHVYDAREEEFGGPAAARKVEKEVLLAAMDMKWREHLNEMDYLKEGIALRQFAQRDPLVEYQREGAELFDDTKFGLKEVAVRTLFYGTFTPDTPIVASPVEEELTFIAPSEDGSPEVQHEGSKS